MTYVQAVSKIIKHALSTQGRACNFIKDSTHHICRKIQDIPDRQCLQQIAQATQHFFIPLGHVSISFFCWDHQCRLLISIKFCCADKAYTVDNKTIPLSFKKKKALKSVGKWNTRISERLAFGDNNNLFVPRWERNYN